MLFKEKKKRKQHFIAITRRFPWAEFVDISSLVSEWLIWQAQNKLIVFPSSIIYYRVNTSFFFTGKCLHSFQDVKPSLSDTPNIAYSYRLQHSNSDWDMRSGLERKTGSQCFHRRNAGLRELKITSNMRYHSFSMRHLCMDSAFHCI